MPIISFHNKTTILLDIKKKTKNKSQKLHTHISSSSSFFDIIDYHTIIMSNSKSYWRKQRWGTPPQTLTPLMEGPDPDMQDERSKKESSWEAIREWFRVHKGISGNMPSPNSVEPLCNSYDVAAKGQDLRLLLGVLGCPLAPISVVVSDLLSDEPVLGSFQIKNVPFVSVTI